MSAAIVVERLELAKCTLASVSVSLTKNNSLRHTIVLRCTNGREIHTSITGLREYIHRCPRRDLPPSLKTHLDSIIMAAQQKVDADPLAQTRNANREVRRVSRSLESLRSKLVRCMIDFTDHYTREQIVEVFGDVGLLYDEANVKRVLGI